MSEFFKSIKEWGNTPEKVLKKEHIPGSGSFLNERNQHSILGHTIVRKWNSKAKGFMTVFSLFWNLIVSAITTSMFKGEIKVNGKSYESIIEAYHHDSFILILLLFPLMGLILTHITLAMWFNKTTFKVEHDKVLVKRGPIPWSGSKIKVMRNNITQCFVQKYCSYQQNNRPVYAYQVIAEQLNGPNIVIEKGMSSYKDARILEQWLEERMNIEDKATPGEVAS